MEHPSEANLRKILIDYTEYERLKHIESKYIDSLKEKKSFQESEVQQSGSGITPEVATFEEDSSTESPAINYDAKVFKNDLNSAFDEERLLALVPKTSIKSAKFLLKEFDKRANELTWNSSGTIFVNQTAIPSSNIFLLFPLLFKKQPPKIEGFIEFLQKINDMGLSDLIIAKPLLKDYETNQITTGNGPILTKIENESEVPWWYIGD